MSIPVTNEIKRYPTNSINKPELSWHSIVEIAHIAGLIHNGVYGWVLNHDDLKRFANAVHNHVPKP